MSLSFLPFGVAEFLPGIFPFIVFVSSLQADNDQGSRPRKWNDIQVTLIADRPTCKIVPEDYPKMGKHTL